MSREAGQAGRQARKRKRGLAETRPLARRGCPRSAPSWIKGLRPYIEPSSRRAATAVEEKALRTGVGPPLVFARGAAQKSGVHLPQPDLLRTYTALCLGLDPNVPVLCSVKKRALTPLSLNEAGWGGLCPHQSVDLDENLAA